MTTVKDKILAILLALAFNAFAAAWTGANSEPSSTKTIDGKKFYVISTPEEMAWFAKEVNNGNTEINAVLNNDIVFGEDSLSICKKNWTPIGVSPSVMYEGVFDGGGFGLYGLAGQTGVFGFVGQDGIVKNLSSFCLSNEPCFSSKITSALNESDTMIVGGVIAVNYGYVENVVNSGKVLGNLNNAYSMFPGVAIAGGVVGKNYGTLSRCINRGRISSNVTASTNQNIFAFSGGIVGLNKGSVMYCINEGIINASSTGENAGYHYRYLGGVVGYNDGPILFCKNNAPVGTYARSSDSYDRVYLGGIVGYNNNTVGKSENNGRISVSDFEKGQGWVGGIAGYTTGTISNCKNSGNIVLVTDYSVQNKTCGILAGGICGGTYGNPGASIHNSIAIMDSVYNNWPMGGSLNCGYGIIKDDSYYSYFDSMKIKTKYADRHREYEMFETISNSLVMKTDMFTWELNTKKAFDSLGINSGVWSRLDSYPIFADAEHLAIRRIVFDGIDTAYTNYKGKVKFPENPKPSSESALFVGWYTHEMQRVDSATVFRADMTVYARFEEKEDVWYSVRFYNADSVLMDSLYLQKWSLPINIKTPSLESTERNEFSFKKWNELVDVVQENRDYYAVYDTLIRQYIIAFVDDTLMLKTMSLEYGAVPNYTEKPSKASSEKYKYTFAGWSPKVDTVRSDMKYQAVYDSVTRFYIVRFMNGNSVLQKDSVAYGDSAKYKGKTPEKTASKLYEYKFAGWSPKLGPIAKQTDYVAVFDSTKLTGIQSSHQINSHLLINVNSRNIQISVAPVGDAYALFDVQGHVLQKGRFDFANFNIVAPRAGSYIIRMGKQTRIVEVK